jgi:hypothetical protein
MNFNSRMAALTTSTSPVLDVLSRAIKQDREKASRSESNGKIVSPTDNMVIYVKIPTEPTKIS